MSSDATLSCLAQILLNILKFCLDTHLVQSYVSEQYLLPQNVPNDSFGFRSVLIGQPILVGTVGVLNLYSTFGNNSVNIISVATVLLLIFFSIYFCIRIFSLSFILMILISFVLFIYNLINKIKLIYFAVDLLYITREECFDFFFGGKRRTIPTLICCNSSQGSLTFTTVSVQDSFVFALLA